MLRKLAIAAVVVALLWVGGLYLKHRRITSGIDRVRVGMTAPEVIAILGTPGKIKPCEGLAKDPNCAKDYVYYPPFEIVSWWTVSLDSSGRVMDKFHWQSP
ncbi:MAG TPA: hypothetical protein VN577_16665 [Terriglobales bacterium]|nr:hypothetical protein [Terriglobales bacterium]